VGLLELDLCPETEPEVAALSLPSFAVPIPFLRSWSIGVFEKIGNSGFVMGEAEIPPLRGGGFFQA
jgi:hypothetical protein